MDDLDLQFHRIKTVGRRQNFHYVWLAFIWLLNILLAAFVYLASHWLDNEYRSNPLFLYEQRYSDLAGRSRELFKEFQSKKSAFNAKTSLRFLTEEEDPQQLLLYYLIDTEREAQNYMLLTLAAASDLGSYITGMEEWRYYEEQKVRQLIANSRSRQKSLRGMLKRSAEMQNR